MRHFQVFLLFPLVVGAAWAQPQVNRNGAFNTAQEQRRAELRSVLKASRVGRAQEQALERELQERNLSEQEKADLRQQLRQQQRDAKWERR